jgi:hypothetical protein
MRLVFWQLVAIFCALTLTVVLNASIDERYTSTIYFATSLALVFVSFFSLFMERGYLLSLIGSITTVGLSLSAYFIEKESTPLVAGTFALASMIGSVAIDRVIDDLKLKWRWVLPTVLIGLASLVCIFVSNVYDSFLRFSSLGVILLMILVILGNKRAFRAVSSPPNPSA